MKFLFMPIGITAGLIAGSIGRRIFSVVWGWLDDEEPPVAKDREISWPKLILAGALQGAIFRAVKQVVDHRARLAFEGVTGTWPGDQRPDPE